MEVLCLPPSVPIAYLRHRAARPAARDTPRPVALVAPKAAWGRAVSSPHDDRPMTRKQLAAELGRELIASTADYPCRRRPAPARPQPGVDGLRRPDRTLHRPRFARTSTSGASSTPLAGLRPLDDDLIAEAARSFDDMESMPSHHLEGLAAADDATRAFLRELLRLSAGPRPHRRRSRLTARRAETAERAAALRTAAVGPGGGPRAAGRRRDARRVGRRLARRPARPARPTAFLRRLPGRRATGRPGTPGAYLRADRPAGDRRAGAPYGRHRPRSRRGRTAPPGSPPNSINAAVSRDAATVADHALTARIPWTPAERRARPARGPLRRAGRRPPRGRGGHAPPPGRRHAVPSGASLVSPGCSLDRAPEAVAAAETAEAVTEAALESAREEARTVLSH